MDRHTMSQQKHPSLGRGHQKTSINVRTIDEWKKKGLISGTEFTYTKCIVKRLLDIKAAAVSKQHEAEATDAIHRSTPPTKVIAKTANASATWYKGAK